MTNRVQIAILDDRPVVSGLPKLAQVGFMNSAFKSKWDSLESLEETRGHDAYGVSLRSVAPNELAESEPEDWENTIFLVDVNWHEIPPDTPGFEELSTENKKSYGVEIAEEIFNIRKSVDDDSIHVIFFSNSRADLVDMEVRRWKQEGVPNVEALFLGDGQYTSPKIVEDAMRAYEAIIALIVRGVKPDQVSMAMNAALKAEKLLQGDPRTKLKLNHFVGDDLSVELKGFRLADLALPFLNYGDIQNPGDSIKRWKSLFDAQFFKMPCIGLKRNTVPSEASIVLQTFLRYGLRGRCSTQSLRLAPEGTPGINFADIYLAGANLTESIKLTDPVLAVHSWLDQGLGTSPKASGEWNFFSLLNHCLSTDLGAVGPDNISKSVPSILAQEGFFSVEKKGWDPDAHLRIEKSGKPRPAIHWSFEVDPLIHLNCPHLDSQRVADQYRDDKAGLEQVWETWLEDREHLELLEILAENLEEVIRLKVSPSDITELGESLLAAHHQLDLAVKRIFEARKLLIECEVEASKKLEESSNGKEADLNERGGASGRRRKTCVDKVLELQKSLRMHGVSRADGWQELSDVFKHASHRCGVDDKPKFSDQYGDQFGF